MLKRREHRTVPLNERDIKSDLANEFEIDSCPFHAGVVVDKLASVNAEFESVHSNRVCSIQYTVKWLSHILEEINNSED